MMTTLIKKSRCKGSNKFFMLHSNVKKLLTNFVFLVEFLCSITARKRLKILHFVIIWVEKPRFV